MNSGVIREQLHKQIDDLPNEAVKQIADFTFSLSQLFHKDTEDEYSLENGERVSGEDAAFGMWADHPEAIKPAAFASKLRHQIEMREDAATYTPD